MAQESGTPSLAWLAALASVLVAVIGAVATITAAFIQARSAAKPIAPNQHEQLLSPSRQSGDRTTPVPAPPVSQGTQKHSTQLPASKASSREDTRLTTLEADLQKLQRARDRDAMEEKNRLSAIEDSLKRSQRLYMWMIAGSVFVALGVVPLTIRNFLSTDRSRRNAERYIERWNSPTFENQKTELVLFLNGTKTAEEVRKPLLLLLNFFESLAMDVLSRSADETALRRAFEAAIILLYDRASDFINQIRVKSSDPSVYSATEKLVHRWRGD
jgi:Domain of unknown function (DUF4760)